ncbi:MAG: cation:proton antiporter [Clostridia bacterium]|nr:cation:proton antiporter [Clostridia bacterium]
MSRPAKLLKLPAVTGYLVAGIIIGPFCLGRLGIDTIAFTSIGSVTQLSIISNAALGFIAFAIGNEFRLSQLKTTGKQATVVGIIQALAATVAVDIALCAIVFFTHGSKLTYASALTLRAIAAATAPAATLMVVKQYKAKGPLTDILLPIVALDDAVGLIIFAVSFGIAKALIHGSIDIISVVVEPFVEIIASLLLGALIGALFTFVERFFHSGSKRTAMSIAFVFMTVSISQTTFKIGAVTVGFSTLLTCMMLGTVFCNLCGFSEELMDRTDKWTSPLFILFFVLSGAELDLTVFSDITIIVIGVVYIISRSAGKYFGAGASCRLVRCEPNITKYLGITLLPQAGVALGMSVTALELGEQGYIVRNIVLFGVLIYELVGPLLTKIALTKAGEIKPEGRTNQREIHKQKKQTA